MRVLIACHGLWPKTLVGGMEIETYHLCKGLAGRKIDVTCAVPSSQVHGDEPFKTLGFHRPQIKPWLWANHLFSRNVVRHMRSHRYDLAYSMGFALAAWRDISGTRLIFHAEGLNAVLSRSIDPRFVWMRAITRHLANAATVVVAESNQIHQVLIGQMGIPPHRVAIVAPGVSIPEPPKEWPRRQKGLVLFVGRFSKEKRVEFLPPFADRIRAVGGNLIAIGDGQLRKKLTDAGIEVRPPLQPADLRSLFWKADLLIIPSQSEGIPRVAMEALGCGCPVMVNRVGGLIDLIDERTVFGVTVGNIEGVVSTATRLLSQNENEKHATSQRAINRAHREFSEERFVSDTLSLFERVMKGTPDTKLPEGKG